jgi:hypothetical protein
LLEALGRKRSGQPVLEALSLPPDVLNAASLHHRRATKVRAVELLLTTHHGHNLVHRPIL